MTSEKGGDVLPSVFGDGFGTALSYRVRETSDAYIVQAALPGVETDKVDIKVRGQEMILYPGDHRPQERSYLPVEVLGRTSTGILSNCGIFARRRPAEASGAPPRWAGAACWR